jgi:hypothetical protein
VWLDGVALRVTNHPDIEEGRAAAERMAQSLRAHDGRDTRHKAIFA